MTDTDDKYIVFKRDDFFQLMGELALPPWRDSQGMLIGGDIDCAPLGQAIKAKSEAIALPDAVVIRRQDKFASPALATYAACIAITAAEVEDEAKRASLIKVADYFEDQAKLAADEGWKLPDV